VSTTSLTMKKISSMTGFSVSTISKALNDKEDVGVETRNIIKDIAKKFNYRPNNYAVALRGKKSKSIAVVLPEVTIKHFSQALSFVQKRAEENSYRVFLYQTFNSEKNEIKCVNNLNDGSVDAIVMISEVTNANTNQVNNDIPLFSLNVTKNHSHHEIKQLSFNCLSNFIEFTS